MNALNQFIQAMAMFGASFVITMVSMALRIWVFIEVLKATDFVGYLAQYIAFIKNA